MFFGSGTGCPVGLFERPFPLSLAAHLLRQPYRRFETGGEEEEEEEAGIQR